MNINKKNIYNHFISWFLLTSKQNYLWTFKGSFMINYFFMFVDSPFNNGTMTGKALSILTWCHFFHISTVNISRYSSILFAWHVPVRCSKPKWILTINFFWKTASIFLSHIQFCCFLGNVAVTFFNKWKTWYVGWKRKRDIVNLYAFISTNTTYLHTYIYLFIYN